MGKEWKAEFVGYIEGRDSEGDVDYDCIFETEEQQNAYNHRMKHEPHPWNNLVTDAYLEEWNDPVSDPVVTRGRYPRSANKWSGEERLRKYRDRKTTESFTWDGAVVTAGMATNFPRPSPDVYGVAFSLAELEDWSDTNTPEAIVAAFEAADDEQSALLGAWEING